ncbi:MAG: hypothetical protein IPJ88_05415 [Myxococcales bacterium]|nr:MAG: hypothetical protein IPJ88_05415 [Myxococcales bacterium]
MPVAECDLYLSADQKIVVIHDETLERTTDGDGKVSEQSLAYLKTLDAGLWYSPVYQQERIPELGELLAVAKDKLVLFLELKDGAGIEKKVHMLLKKLDMQDDVAIFSFDKERIKRSKEINPDVAALWLVARPKDGGSYQMELVDQAVALDADAVGLDFPYINKAVVDAAHEAGLYVYAWTVNDSKQAVSLSAMGVDGFISDLPDQIASKQH